MHPVIRRPATALLARTPAPLRQVAWLGLLAVAYWVSARAGLQLALVRGQVTPLWPPTGIAVVSFLILGRRVWPAIALGAFAVNLPIGPSPLGAAIIASGNTLAPLLAAELLRRVGFDPAFGRIRDALAIIAAALVGMAVSATIGTSVLALAGAAPGNDFWSTWAVWWTGDAMGVLLVAPFLISLLPQHRRHPMSWQQGVELAALLIVTAAVTAGMFLASLPIVYFSYPLVMLAAWRFALRGAAPAALLASLVAIWMAVHGIGRFDGESLVTKMVTLQAFNVGLTLASFMLVAFVETERRKQEVSRLYMAARLASETKSAFLNMAAHELRTPISVLHGYLSILRDGSLGEMPPGSRPALDILTSKAHELNKIVRDLLDAAQVEASVLPRTQAVIDLRTSVSAAIERARARADLLHGQIAVSLDPQPVCVEVDSEQLGRILDNLINNALSYTQRPPQVSISVAAVDGRAVVRVVDNGVGIHQDEWEKVFDRFHRANEPAFRNVRGTGLGLYISRGLADANRGTLRIERSEPGAGTTFALSVPLAVTAPFAVTARA